MHYKEVYRRDRKNIPASFDIARLNGIMLRVEQKRSEHVNANFFKRIRGMRNYLGQFRQSQAAQCLTWALDFPIVPVRSCADIMRTELFPYNFPYIYIYAVTGMVERLFYEGRLWNKIRKAYRDFERVDLKQRRAHDQWYRRRLPGSFETGNR